MSIGKRLSQARVRVHTEVPDIGKAMVTEIGIILFFEGDGDLAGCWESPEREIGVVLRKGAKPREVIEGLRSLATLIENEGV